jgi:hypothetical protein
MASVTIDIGFGDALEPGAEELDYPSMLDFPMPRLRGPKPDRVACSSSRVSGFATTVPMMV